MERHLDDRGGGLPLLGKGAKRVGISISESSATDPEGQALLWTACNLLCRLEGVVGELVVCVPAGIDVAAAAAAPHPAPGRGDLGKSLVDSLCACSRGCHVRLARGELDRGLDAAVLLGTGASAGAEAAFEIRAACAGWLAYVWQGSGPGPGTSAPGGGYNPFGAAAAACLAVGEVFKHLGGLDIKRGRFAESLCFSTYDLRVHGWHGDAPANPVLPARINLGRLAVCGAGAVAHSFCQAIASLGGAQADLLIVDRKINYSMGDETIEPTNLARYVMAAGADVGRPKAEVLCERVRTPCIRAGHTDDGIEALASRGGLSGEDHVVSCVDNNRARHAIQGCIPRIIRGGSVYDLSSRVSVYDMAGGTACLRCENPVEAGESDEDVAERLRAMGPDQRRAEAGRAGVDAGDLDRYLESPACGTLSGDALRRLAAALPPEFSVNFATMLSGTLLAAEATKAACTSLRPALDGGAHSDMFYSFWNCRHRLSRTAPFPECWCRARDGTPRDIHGEKWGQGAAGGRQELDRAPLGGTASKASGAAGVEGRPAGGPKGGVQE